LRKERPGRMKYVIVYDVPEDGLRLHVAELLEGFGSRVQKSVFECELEGGAAEELMVKIERELRGTERGNVRIYRLCANCEAHCLGIGAVKVVEDGGKALIL
jgi:CRISPR-associated protein Cas2